MELTTEEAIARARSLADSGRRCLVGITGEPGAGKSTLSARIRAVLGDRAAVVPMDGFHLAQSRLEELRRADRKGAPDTFDAWGFVALVRRLAAAEEPVTYAPEYRRDLHNGVAGAIAVDRDVPLVIVEGNYLLVDSEPWDLIPGLMTETWYIDVDEDVRMRRLVARHEHLGKPHDAAVAWAGGPDERNAALIRSTRSRADAVVRV
ncbi:MAG: nucleoside/nucleotide kinase family protein [Acidipropionibacterium acidipropionici]|jgi:pantothenate kinase|uniref:nucleoside/nucleotide kinase family protein n=1 Tax=Acidipropionibacterium acidipropionici TaxID=1748 RepID=UPI002F355500